MGFHIKHLQEEIKLTTIDVTKLKDLDYQILFVRFKRDVQSAFVNVTLDGWHLTWFNSAAETEEEFAKDCEEFVESAKYKEAYNAFMGGK